MYLELKPINDKNIEVFSKKTSKFVGTILLSPVKNDWVFRAVECGCVWTVESLNELTKILINMNK